MYRENRAYAHRLSGGSQKKTAAIEMTAAPRTRLEAPVEASLVLLRPNGLRKPLHTSSALLQAVMQCPSCSFCASRCLSLLWHLRTHVLKVCLHDLGLLSVLNLTFLTGLTTAVSYVSTFLVAVGTVLAFLMFSLA